MGKIKILNDNMINLVSAGEVIERPASVVKELVENSIDSESTRISVEIKNGGKKLIHVSDNGSGILRNDIRLAFISHATSKIYEEIDLEKISTLGFRGEALPSICTVSKLDLMTCSKDESIGSHYRIEGGTEVFLKDSPSRSGTSIMIRDLFFNTPARMKFLKKDITEGNYIHSLIDKMVLSHPEISFKFIRNGKNIVSSVGDGKVTSAILRVFGKEFLENLLEINYTLDDMSINGFISDPSQNSSNSKVQNIFINGRWVKDKIISNAVDFALNDEFQNKKISFILYLTVPWSLVDVNVHPTKTEVRFSDEKKVFTLVYDAIKNSISQNRKKLFITLGIASKKNADGSNLEKILDKSSDDILNKTDISLSPGHKDCSILSDNVVIPKYSETKLSSHDYPEKMEPSNCSQVNLYSENQKNYKKFESIDYNLKIIGEIFDCFFLLQYEDKLILVDKHAAHERIIFENLVSSDRNNCSQILVSSLVINFSQIEHECILEHIEKIKEIGYEIEDFGPGKILVRGIPIYLNKNDIRDSLYEIVKFFQQSKIDVELNELKKVYSQIACKSAIKSGRDSSWEEIKSLVNKLLEERVTNCPHGRPIFVYIEKNEIYKRFLRKK